MATLMHISHDNGTIITGEIMNWNVSVDDAEKIIWAREKEYISRAISQNKAMIDEALAPDDSYNRDIVAEVHRLTTLLEKISENPPTLEQEGRVARYLSEHEKGSGYVLMDASWT